ncbi:hypothetical protein C1A_73 [Wolbachia endosymbiont of Culex quinquefasciatus JHB]|uniref:hypothetical protein n=1 Tax=Wolbachia TaxID=953 RepID=UPI0001761DD7|nr:MULTISPECIES: hypothetical protein [unclassified Wolbachia]EEB55483.1 hypothetical protein C1A_73 [Wolbachia endosymbiont of Culex quinquefasciatus JHB]CAQ54589.1 hypothetical protein WP0481 [Wolbachia endosymbiont of Culex quinquefasciatus Pel]CQD07803.1 Uncharacterised protein [Wolbachia endosymbiont wPip_Mol of Culex molestus]
MSNSIQEKKGNPVVTLKAQAEKFDFSALRASKDNTEANSGSAMYKDFPRMKFIIQNKVITKELVDELYNKHKDLISNDKNNKYRQFAKQVFTGLFEYAEAEVPSDPILEELVTNCNQAGYEGALFTQTSLELGNKHGLTLQTPVKVINIDCTDINHITVKSHMEIPVVEFDNPEKKLSELSSSLKFTLESQDGKDDVTYKDGKLSLTVPRELKNYKIDGKSLFDIIKEYFYKFCEKLGFKFEVEIEHNLGDSIEVNSHLESVQPPTHSNEHENTPGN